MRGPRRGLFSTPIFDRMEGKFHMKKSLAALAALVALSILFAGALPAFAMEGERLSVVATNFPGFDFARTVAGGNCDVELLLPPGAESHTYEPTPRDILKIQNADLFIYAGGEGDAWVDDILSSMDHAVPALGMVDLVDAVAEVTVEGMTEEEHHHDEDGADHDEDSADHEGDHEEDDHADEEGRVHGHPDEHVWTAPKNADLIQKAIARELAVLDPANAAAYEANSAAYAEALTALDQAFIDFFAGVSNRTLIVGDRFPLRYFADAYGLTYYAAFPGCSTETEPSAYTIAFLTDKVRDGNVSTVFYIEFSNHLVADSIAEQTGAKTALFHSCHNVSKAELDAGVSYLSLMEGNLETLKGAMM